MNHIERLCRESTNLKEFTGGYFKYLYGLLKQIKISTIDAFARELENARLNNKTIFLIGNGGSAATASHMANDFGPDILKRTRTEKPFKMMSLTDNCAVMLAVANDSGYENLFVNQLKVHYRKGDVLVAISASGNSSNVVEAAIWIKKNKGKVLSLVGFDGGKLKDISDVTIHVKTDKGEYGPVEDIHMILDHLISSWVQQQIQKNKS